MTDHADSSLAHLSWFLGPKSEHREHLESLLLYALRDYVHWRANYFPSDEILISRTISRSFESNLDLFHEQMGKLLAHLRHNFPFYSPRYFGHMLSDVSLPAIVGYFAGMLYNPNNITPEAAPRTVSLELDACNKLMAMLGFVPPPDPLPDETESEYARRLPTLFGWAHTTFDGTIATLEALWVARAVKTIPLAVRDALSALPSNPNRRLDFHSPNGVVRNILDPSVADRDLLLLSPQECLDLMDRYLSLASRELIDPQDRSDQLARAHDRAWKTLNDSFAWTKRGGTHTIFSVAKPKVFCTGAAHYSVAKALDVLGIGWQGEVRVEMDSSFRMNIDDLDAKLRDVLSDPNAFPLAVIGVLGTTEEGAVDPLHRIMQSRSSLEREGASVWVHCDAAFGGYLRSLFARNDRDLVDIKFKKLSEHLRIPYPSGQTPFWYKNLLKWVADQSDWKPEQIASTTRLAKEMSAAYLEQRYADVLRGLEEFRLQTGLRGWSVPPEVLAVTDKDVCLGTKAFTHSQKDLAYNSAIVEKVDLSWQDDEVYNALLAVGQSDSVVCDPHKMGYALYPAGMIAYRDNRARTCIRHHAPYITSVQGNVRHYPPRYPKRNQDTGDRLWIEAFGPFILEGSRPGAVASGLWLATECIPPTITGAESFFENGAAGTTLLEAG